jgi:hypothetical protein
VASALGVVAGIFLAPALRLDPFFMLDPFLKGFAAAVLGGLNSLPGAVVGALILGVAESLTGADLTIQVKNTLAFVVISAVLLARPEGLRARAFKARVSPPRRSVSSRPLDTGAPMGQCRRHRRHGPAAQRPGVRPPCGCPL